MTNRGLYWLNNWVQASWKSLLAVTAMCKQMTSLCVLWRRATPKNHQLPGKENASLDVSLFGQLQVVFSMTDVPLFDVSCTIFP